MPSLRNLLATLSLVLCPLLIATSVSTPAIAGPDDDPVRALSPSDRRTFAGYTRLFCRQFFRYDDYDKFIILPNYVRDRDASTGKTFDQVFEEMSYKEIRRENGISREITIRPPRDEALAASMIIPAIEVGHYGYLNSVEIAQIISEDEAIITDVQYIYPEAERIRGERADVRIGLARAQKALEGVTYRLIGFKTEEMTVGQRWTGPDQKGVQIAVAGTDPAHNFVLVNFERLRPVRTAEFPDVLAYISMEPLEFNELIRSNREDAVNISEGDKTSLIEIYKIYYNRFRVPRASVGQTAAVRPEPPAARPEPVRNDPEPEPEPEPEKPTRVTLDIPDREPEPQQPEREPEPEQPEEAPEPAPQTRDEPEDDWKRDDAGPAPDAPTFFGMPVG